MQAPCVTMAARSMPSAGGKLPRNSRDLAGGEACARPAGSGCGVTYCKSSIAAPAECYLLFDDGGLHGAAPCGDPEPIGSARDFARGRLPALRQRAEWQKKSGPNARGNCLMSITTAMTSVPKPAPDLIEAFRGAPTSVISDNLARLPGAVGLRPFHRGSKLVGVAFTVRTRPGDNLAIHRALDAEHGRKSPSN